MGAMAESRSGKTRSRKSECPTPICLIPGALRRTHRWRLLCKVILRGNVVTYRMPLLWYRGVRRAVEIVVFLGSAALLSYLVIQSR